MPSSTSKKNCGDEEPFLCGGVEKPTDKTCWGWRPSGNMTGGADDCEAENVLGLGVRGGIYLSVSATGNRSINGSADGRRAGFSTVFSSCWPAITTTST